MQTPGTITLRRMGWGPAVLKEIQNVAPELPAVGGKWPIPFAPLTGHGPPCNAALDRKSQRG